MDRLRESLLLIDSIGSTAKDRMFFGWSVMPHARSKKLLERAIREELLNRARFAPCIH